MDLKSSIIDGSEIIYVVHWHSNVLFCLFVFVALRPKSTAMVRPKSTAMVIAGRSVHLSTLFPGQA